MKTAVLLHLPDDVERFEPVARCLRGPEFLIGSGRWAPARRDSRTATRQRLLQRGWTALEHPEPRFDLILATAAGAPGAVAKWLAPGGRVVLWHEAWLRSRFLHAIETPTPRGPHAPEWIVDPVVARVCTAWSGQADGIDPARVEVVGDPRLDAVLEPGAASRARHHLGLDADRPVVLVAVEAWMHGAAWSRAIAALRVDRDVILLPSTPCWLENDGEWPRAWQGPGLRALRPDEGPSLAEVLALADLVIAPLGPHAHAARMCGRRTVLVAEGPEELRTRGDHRPWPGCCPSELGACFEPSELGVVVDRAFAEPAPPRAVAVDGGAVERLAQVFERLARREHVPTLAR